MLKEDAKLRIRQLYREYPDENKSEPMNIMMFYQHLKKQHPEVLNFRKKRTDDPYQIVKGFVADLVP